MNDQPPSTVPLSAFLDEGALAARALELPADALNRKARRTLAAISRRRDFTYFGRRQSNLGRRRFEA